MAAGTAAALVPIKSITMNSRNDTFKYNGGSDEPGPICVKFLTTLKGIQTGKIKDTFGWNEKVQEHKRTDFERAGEVTNGVGHEMIDTLP